jgi:heme/copper-type cytochrome/quinol oxidase subunit 2
MIMNSILTNPVTTHEITYITSAIFRINQNYIYTEFKGKLNLRNVYYQSVIFRLLDTDNRVVLPINSPIRIIVTAADILHS